MWTILAMYFLNTFTKEGVDTYFTHSSNKQAMIPNSDVKMSESKNAV